MSVGASEQYIRELTQTLRRIPRRDCPERIAELTTIVDSPGSTEGERGQASLIIAGLTARHKRTDIAQALRLFDSLVRMADKSIRQGEANARARQTARPRSRRRR